MEIKWVAEFSETKEKMCVKFDFSSRYSRSGASSSSERFPLGWARTKGLHKSAHRITKAGNAEQSVTIPEISSEWNC